MQQFALYFLNTNVTLHSLNDASIIECKLLHYYFVFKHAQEFLFF